MDFCTWEEKDGVWSTDCHHDFVINEGTPKENQMKFCCYCGKLIEEIPEEEKEC